MAGPKCAACGGEMRKKTVYEGGGCGGCVVSLLVLAAGILIFLLIPVIGWVIGPVICLGAVFIGRATSKKVWRCRSCRSVIPRG